jgi:anti-anti-sigma factor
MVELSDDFSLRLAYEADRAAVTVAVSGDIDMLTAPVLAGVLQALVDGGRSRIVVDLAECGCVDGRGAAVFAAVAVRAAAVGGKVTIRAASPMTRRLLSITGVTDLVLLDVSRVDLSPSGDSDASDKQTTDAVTAGLTSMPAPAGLTRSRIDMVDAALRLVTALADAAVTNADGVSVTLERHGRLMTVAASNDKVLTMDRHQYETGEGPCLDAKAHGRWYYIDSLADETRWPAFVPLALEQGIHSILSSPLKTTDRAQGALNIYSTTKQAFGEREQELAALFADQASQILTAAGQEPTEADNNERFNTALAARQLIHQAQGVIMARDGVTTNDAMESLFRSAREANMTVLGHATDLVASLRPDLGTS